jgi:predicted ribosomally synthesized peptide with nif11-like leader
MSQLQEFYQLIKQDAELQQKLTEAKDLPSEAVELGKTKGYHLTREEVERFLNRGEEEGELNELELEYVAGGKKNITYGNQFGASKHVNLSNLEGSAIGLLKAFG